MDHVATIVANRLSGGRLAPLSGMDEDGGYALQARANAELAKELGGRAGYKIGGTTAPMRQLLRIAQPVAGEIFASTVHGSGASLPLAGYVRPGVETEIAVRLGTTVLASGAPYDRASIAAHVAALIPAIEIVDNRYEDFTTAGAGTFAADNNFNAGSVLGQPVEAWQGLALERLRAETFIDGKRVAEALSDQLMGHPLEALAWLANRYAALGRDLEAGCFVSLGTITPVQWVTAPAKVRIAIEGLGEVTLALT